MPNETLRRLHEEHKQCARLLDLLDSESATLETGGMPDFQRMHDVVHYLVTYVDAVHHPLEDLILERLALRSPAAAPLVERLRGEHRDLAELGERLQKLLYGCARGAVTARAPVLTLTREYIAGNRVHMRAEELEALPQAHGLLEPRDWAAVKAAHIAAEDPVFGPVMQRAGETVREILEQRG